MDDYTPEHRANDEDPLIGDAPPQAHTLFSSAVFDKLKWASLVLLPSIAAAYFALGSVIEGLPAVDEVVGTIVVLETFLGALLGISHQQYQNSDARFDGRILVSPGQEEDTTELRVQLDPAAVAEKDEVTVKVKRV